MTLTGCDRTTVEKENKAVLRIAGSTSMIPVSQELAGAFEKKHPGVVIHIEGGDSSLGIRGAASGIVDVGSVSRSLTQEERSNLTSYRIAEDQLCIIVNGNNTIKEMTINQVKEVFGGEIRNWSQVGGLDRPITLITREQGSGTYSVFDEVIMRGKASIDPKALVMTSTGSVISTVAGDADAIGYISSDYSEEGVKAVKIDTGENSLSALSRPLLYVLPDNAGQLAQDFISFCTGKEGRQVIEGRLEN
ncbi:MAG: hypothetical protein JL50_12230 [Peptococcaceae bacterium BICA1-7]|nr:MAG: hypothetical protein JL50_12230 [Peptococcaceae bacterium BICA1-7]